MVFDALNARLALAAYVWLGLSVSVWGGVALADAARARRQGPFCDRKRHLELLRIEAELIREDCALRLRDRLRRELADFLASDQPAWRPDPAKLR